MAHKKKVPSLEEAANQRLLAARLEKLTLAGRIFGAKHLAALVLELEQTVREKDAETAKLTDEVKIRDRALQGPQRYALLDDFEAVCELAESMTGCMWPEDMKAQREMIQRVRLEVSGALQRVGTVDKAVKQLTGTGRRHSPETRQKMRDAWKRRNANIRRP